MTILWVICLTLVVLERFSAAGIRVVQTDFASDALRAFACQFAAAFPEALFLLALWWVRAALADIARGALFAMPMTRMLDRVGIVLACGAFARIVLVPGACRLLGFSAGHWIAFDAEGMVLAALGLALKAIAGVLRQASRIQSELDEIF
ncbi:MAG: DUF2975 domain-containing protein [Acidobacteria bacterium]|nr:DUF2975 domain-containing protein [Acidobacteriota bacterium]MBV9478582.1 DUF2975 domain-containing protein [Acidobacteriota bacterium]